MLESKTQLVQVLIVLYYLSFCVVDSFRIIESLKYSLTRIKSTNDDSNSISSSIWRDKVRYFDLSSSPSSSTQNSRNLPLFLLGGAFFPQGVTFLHIFEMKYRTMMFDISNSDKLFGYIHTDSKTGQIGCVGTLCKIRDIELLEDGRQYIALEGIGRFSVQKIVKTLPYILAEVETDLHDDQPIDIEADAKMEISLYDSLKYYMRIMKTYEPNKNMVVSPATKQSRPSLKSPTLSEDLKRRTDFSFAIANMIQMTYEKESQLLLQTTNAYKRLEAEKIILCQAAEVIAEQLIQMNMLTAERKDEIKSQAYTSEYDADILPEDKNIVDTEDEQDEWDIANVM